MRGNRRGGHGLEFGGSGEDSFVAVVVTKLTGALLFILLVTMVIMALLPKVAELPSPGRTSGDPPRPLAVTTSETLPEAIVGHPYHLALASTGGQGPLQWSVSGDLPEGMTLDPSTGRIEGTPTKGTPNPADLVLAVSDGHSRATRSTRLLVYESDKPLTTPVWWKPGIPPVPWRAWLEQGFGFLMIGLVHAVGMNTVGSLQRWSLGALDADPSLDGDRQGLLRRFGLYRGVVRLASLSAAAGLAVWLWNHHA